MKKWLVLWKDNGRIGSVELTPENLAYLKQRFCMDLIQRDATGTEHWNVLGQKGKR